MSYAAIVSPLQQSALELQQSQNLSERRRLKLNKKIHIPWTMTLRGSRRLRVKRKRCETEKNLARERRNRGLRGNRGRPKREAMNTAMNSSRAKRSLLRRMMLERKRLNMYPHHRPRPTHGRSQSQSQLLKPA